jgi:hypothetical protein
MAPVHYELAVDSWSSSERVVIKSPVGQTVAVFPVPFIRRCGDNRWTYIFRVLDDLVETGADVAWTIRDQGGREVGRGEEPMSGTYVFAQNGEFCWIFFPSIRSVKLMGRR